MDDLTFRVTPSEAETILEALGNLRFSAVYRLIGKLQNQAAEQLAAADKAAVGAAE
jgi:hypothetical protein